MNLSSISTLVLLPLAVTLNSSCDRNSGTGQLANDGLLPLATRWNDEWNGIASCQRDRDCGLRRFGAIESIHDQVLRIVAENRPTAQALCNRGEEAGCRVLATYDQAATRVESERRLIAESTSR